MIYTDFRVAPSSAVTSSTLDAYPRVSWTASTTSSSAVSDEGSYLDRVRTFMAYQLTSTINSLVSTSVYADSQFDWLPTNYLNFRPRERTPEELVRAEVHRQARILEEDERRLARGKAEELLRRVLSPEQLMNLEQKDHFFVRAQDGHKYRIDRGWAGNIKRVSDETGEVLKTFCLHPKMWTPDQDSMLAQKLLLETSTEKFFQIYQRKE